MELAIRQSDHAEVASLPEAVRQELRMWIRALATVTPPIQSAMERIARDLGVSPSTARRKYDTARADGWRGLINRAKAPEKRRAGLSQELIEHWQKLVGLNQRAARPAYRMLVRAFHSGEQIPGVPNDCPRDRLPTGWSYANFMRHAPTKFELTALRQGLSAAKPLSPMVYTTRRDLWVGSHYLFDDLVHDHFVNVLDTRQTGRPLEFHALDLASACKFAWGIRIRTENELTGRMEGLREENMRALVAQILAQHGYHADRGTTLIVEHGTAAIREPMERLIHDLSGGKIRVQRSGIEGAAAHAGQYAGRPKGNFRFKAALESLGNLVHNEMAFLPAQTGLSTDRRPEEIHGLLRHNDALLDAVEALAVSRPELAAALRFPVMSDRQFTELCIVIYNRINSRTEHDLEGWDLRVVPDESDPMRMRRMSPLEVWRGGRSGLTRFRPEQVAQLIYVDSAIERTVVNGEITFADSEISGDRLRFDASRWVDGEKFATVLNPFSPDALFCFDARGRFAGCAPRVQRACKSDDHAVREALGRANHLLAERLAPVRRLGREIAEQRLADARHNAAILEAATSRPSQSPEAKAVRAGAAMAAAIGAVPGAMSDSGSDAPCEEIHLGTRRDSDQVDEEVRLA